MTEDSATQPPIKKAPPEDFEELTYFSCGCNFQGFTDAETLVFEACRDGSNCPNYVFFLTECAKAGKVPEGFVLASGFIVDADGQTL